MERAGAITVISNVKRVVVPSAARVVILSKAKDLLLLLLITTTASAQTDTTKKPVAPTGPVGGLTVGPPVRRIATASAVSTEQLGSINGVRQLRDGRVLLNDNTRRRLLLLDTAMKVVEVVLDSLSESSNFYGTRGGSLLAFRADTTLFLDPAAYAMIVIDPQGKMIRVRAVPRTSDANNFSGNNGNGMSGVDDRGRVIFRQYAESAPPKVAPPPGMPWFPNDPDSAFVVGVDVETRKVDTLGVLRIPRQENSVRINPQGGFNFTSVTNPLPSTDEWAVLPDGVIAFVRGRDYRVEYRSGDGKMVSSAKLPYPWQHLTEDDKQKLVDSVRAEQTKQAMAGYVASLIRWVNQWGNEYPKDLVVPADFKVQQGLLKSWKLPPGVTVPANYIYGCAPGEEPTQALPTDRPSCIPGPSVIPGGFSPPMPQLRTNGVMAPAELPDYRPPFQQGSVRADGDGNLWVRINTPKPVSNGLLYDVISRQGELVDRIQLPQGYSLVGFGAGKIVYLSTRDAKGQHLARVVLK